MTDAPLLTHFIEGWADKGIHLDDFQLEACRAIAAQKDVLLTAPTGAGKTLVALYAVEQSLATNQRCVYTAPIKALSNQKFRELCERYGEEHIGLLTGDETIRREAPVLVVTTEVLRNMLLLNPHDVDDLAWVILDEVHYLADLERGPVWEEVILTLAPHVRLLALSATIANIQDFAGWMRSIRDEVAVVETYDRPVPLTFHVANGSRIAAPDSKAGKRPSSRPLTDRLREEVLRGLDAADYLPAIHFIFSRKGCDLAVRALTDEHVCLTTPGERRRIQRELDDFARDLSEEERRAVQWRNWERAYLNGYGAHHAGMLPHMKGLVEKLMGAGLLKIVYATSTLALGIDMPVRSVVIEGTSKWNGTEAVPLTATEFVQMAGRAGRRGRDVEGHVILLNHSEFDLGFARELISAPVEPLHSAFTPSYNTVMSLLLRYSYPEARQLLSTSFMQYQRNGELVGISRRIGRVRAKIAAEEKALVCPECGPFADYLRAVRDAGRAAKSQRKSAKENYRKEISRAFHAVEGGKVYALAVKRELEYALVLSTDFSGEDRARHRIRVLTTSGELQWIRLRDVTGAPREVGAVNVPLNRRMRDPEARADVTDALIDAVAERLDLGIDSDLTAPWTRFATAETGDFTAFPAHQCEHRQEHLNAASALYSLDTTVTRLSEKEAEASDSIGRECDATAEILREYGLVQGEIGPDLTPGPGARMLAGIHASTDLLLYLCLEEAVVQELSPRGFAAWCTLFLSDSRLGEQTHGFAPDAVRAVQRNLEDLLSRERAHGIHHTDIPYPGGALAFYLWLDGTPFDQVLRMSRTTPGDFISSARRLVDLLGQLVAIGEGTWLEESARQARTMLKKQPFITIGALG